MLLVEYKGESGDVLLREEEPVKDFGAVMTKARAVALMNSSIKRVVIRDALGDAELDLTYPETVAPDPVWVRLWRKAFR
jgi:hypothetical protein